MNLRSWFLTSLRIDVDILTYLTFQIPYDTLAGLYLFYTEIPCLLFTSTRTSTLDAWIPLLQIFFLLQVPTIQTPPSGSNKNPPQAKQVAVLIPGTQTPQDCVTDLKALPVQVVADGRWGSSSRKNCGIAVDAVWYKGKESLFASR